MNSYKWTSRGKQVKTPGEFEVDVVTALEAQIKSLSKKLDGMMTPRAAPVMSCETCIGGHPTTECPIVSAFLA